MLLYIIIKMNFEITINKLKTRKPYLAVCGNRICHSSSLCVAVTCSFCQALTVVTHRKVSAEYFDTHGCSPWLPSPRQHGLPTMSWRLYLCPLSVPLSGHFKSCRFSISFLFVVPPPFIANYITSIFKSQAFCQLPITYTACFFAFSPAALQ